MVQPAEDDDRDLRDDIARALAAFVDLVLSDIDADAIALRVTQYAACIAGEYCPEVAFDPVATSFRTIAARLGGRGAPPRHLRSRGVGAACRSSLAVAGGRGGRDA
jgi:hypothetical protein